MRGLRLGLLLAGTAAVLAAPHMPAFASRLHKHQGASPVMAPAAEASPKSETVSPESVSVQNLVPVPDTTFLPPPTAADVTAPTNGVAPAPAAQPSTTATAPEAPAAEPNTTATVPTAPADQPSSTTAAPAAQPPSTTAPATQPAAAAAPALSPADQPIADKLREALTGKADRIIDHKNKPAVDAFYAARNYAPLWIDNGTASERAKAVATFLAKVDADGLDPADYPLPDIKTAADPAALADAELKYTATVLTYARHAQIGRVHFSRISGDISFNLVAPEAGDVLGGLVDTKDIAGALERFEPPHAGYQALKAKLAEVRAAKGAPAGPRIGSGPVLKLAKSPMQDPRVPLLRERLGVAGEADDTTYTKTLADAVKAFQESHKLAENGQLNAATIEAINGPRHDRDVDIIIANMERWRWLPRDLGKSYVMVNIPDYTLKVVHNGTQAWKTKIVSGAPGNKATPLLSETMKYITVNPTWNVPPSIINNEYLPALAQDPTVLDRMGLKLEHNRDGTVHIYQPPGERNALGRIRFNFPNKFLVYQHDTPDKHLFARAVRDYSHGCMRVENPDKYAEVLLSLANPGEGYSVDRIHRMYGTGEIDIHLKTPIPVHITYQTAYVDDAGKLVIRDDIYGRDQRYFALMKSDERKVADVATENREGFGTVARPARLPDNYPSFANNGGNGLFGWLFGGPNQGSNERTGYPPTRRQTWSR
jgi:murein L,D-transpeptidase YcbB/YkuD